MYNFMYTFSRLISLDLYGFMKLSFEKIYSSRDKSIC